MPTNKKLMGDAPTDEDKGELAKKWGRLHLARTCASAAAFVTMAVALARLKHT